MVLYTLHVSLAVLLSSNWCFSVEFSCCVGARSTVGVCAHNKVFMPIKYEELCTKNLERSYATRFEKRLTIDF